MTKFSKPARKSKNKQVSIRTPYNYPNGDVLDLSLTKQGNSLTLTDKGKTMHWLANQASIDIHSPAHKQLVEWFCNTRGIEYHNGELTLSIENAGALSLDMQKLGETVLEMTNLLTSNTNEKLYQIAKN